MATSIETSLVMGLNTKIFHTYKNMCILYFRLVLLIYSADDVRSTDEWTDDFILNSSL